MGRSAAAAFAIALVLASSVARADMLPANVRPCDDKQVGERCTTDDCHPGACGTIANARCPASDPTGCVLCRARDAGPCDEECARKTTPCVFCLADDPSLRRAPDPKMDRFAPCGAHEIGAACRTTTCDLGACTEGDGDTLVCRSDPPRDGRLATAATAIAIMVLVGAIGLGIRTRVTRSREHDRPPPKP